MKIFENIIGQPHVVATLKDAVTGSRNTHESTHEMTHSWLFTGPPGSGRSVAATCFAAALVCPNDGCNECVDCDTATNGSHVDVEIMKTEGLSIKVDEIRELVSRASWVPSVSGWRVVILEDAERLTEAAANALLKAIEEPNSRTVWLLCAPSISDLTPTIRSRCRILSLRTPTNEDIVKLLVERDGISPVIAEYAAQISQGHIGRAKFLAQNPDSRSRRKQITSLIFNLRTTADALKASKEFIQLTTEEWESESIVKDEKEIEKLRITFQSKESSLLSGGSKAIKELEKNQKARKTRELREGIDNALLDLASIYRDILLVKSDSDVSLINADIREEIIRLANETRPETVLSIFDSIMRIRLGLSLNGAPALLVEEFFTSLI